MKDNELFYQMIFKRKSFHIFKEILRISQEELDEIESVYSTLHPLDSSIKTDIRIVPNDEVTCKRGQEYCVLLYSEKKENYLQNIGYLASSWTYIWHQRTSVLFGLASEKWRSRR